MGPPTVWQHVRQTIGRAIRETGQALDRLGVKTASFAATKHDYYDDPVIYEDHFSRHRHQFPLLYSGRPIVHSEVAFLAPCSTLIGSVRIGRGSSVWYGAVIRADQCENAESHDQQEDGPWELEEPRYRDRMDRHGGAIYIGENTNIQDGCILSSRDSHCKIGDGVTVGHLAQIHGATVEDFCLIGMGSIIQEGALIETEAFVAAGAVVGPGEVVRSGELWVGNPARKVRELSAEERKKLHYQSNEYVSVATNQNGVMEIGGNVTAPESPEVLELKWNEEAETSGAQIDGGKDQPEEDAAKTADKIQ